MYSRYLSRQCALTSEWTGNGFDTSTAFAEDSNIDLTELSNGHNSLTGNLRGTLVYDVSTCGSFLLIARDALVDVYDLRADPLLLVNRLVCPRRVLCMSMDASSGHHAVALLLEGRMGQVCELSDIGDNDDLACVQAHATKQFSTVHIQSNHQLIRVRGVDDHRRDEPNLITTS